MNMRHFFWGVLGCVAFGFLLAVAPASGDGEETTGVSEESYADMMANEVLDVQDLAEGAEIQRRFFNRITPPGANLLQPMFPSVAPFDSVNFDEVFLESLLGEDANSVAIYPLSLVLDSETHETLVYNAEGELVVAVPSDGISRTWPENSDPSRVILQLDLLPAEDVEQYLYTEDRIEETLASAAKASKKPSKTSDMVMRSVVGTADFGILDFTRLTNGNFRLTVTNGTDIAEVFSYTVVHTPTVTTNERVVEGVTNIVTNTLWSPVSPSFDGLESEWECQTTNLVLTNGVGVWEDSGISTNARVRFYGVAERADSDWDGLSDGAELFVYHTSPTNRDTDGDGWSDAEELTEETDPLDRFSATRLAKGVVIHGVCYNPSNGFAASNQWMQLHSSSASPVNLGEFRLQVAGSNYETKLTFPSNTWIQPGHFILIGGANIGENDHLADLDLQNSYPTNPTTGARLVGPEGVETNPADVVMYGTHSPFNEEGLPTNGWVSTNTDLWAGISNQLVRTRLGQDTDMRSDWTYQLVDDVWNSDAILDSDGDGLTDEEEYSGSSANGVQSDPLDPDSDDDGLEDGFEADHNLNPENSDSDGDSTLDPDEINPETGNTYLEDQLGTDVSVAIDSSLPDWVLGQSIGSNGWVSFTCESWEGVGVWATIKEGGDAPEDFTCAITNATIAYSNDIINGGFRTLKLLLISTNHAVPIEVIVNDGGTYWTNQNPVTYGPDIFAHFDAVKVTLDALSFSGTNYYYVFTDDGLTAYSEPQWITPKEEEEGRSYPLCYVRGSIMKVMGGWDILPDDLPADLNVQIQGLVSEGMEFPWASMARYSGVRWYSPVMECSNAFDSVVNYYNPMHIDWYIQMGTCTTSLFAGASTNQCYITYDVPVIADLRHTLVQLGCSNGMGMSTESTCTEAIWSVFTNRDVRRVDGVQMTYYQDYHCTNSTTSSLLINGDGQCGAWVNLFIDILKAQGIDYPYEWATIEPKDGDDGFAFKQWSFAEPGQSGDSGYPYLNIPASNYMGSTNYNWIYEDVIDISGIPGQGVNNPRSLFLEHYVFINGQYYDPSTGVKYADLEALESEYIDGYFKYNASYPVNEQVVNVDLDGNSVIENTNVYVEVFLFRKNTMGNSITNILSDK